MRIRTLLVLSVLLGLLVPLLSPPAWAQQSENRSNIEFLPVGPPPERPYRPWDPYSLAVTLEVGGQIAEVDGNHEVWESQQNYRDGFKVFSFDIHGKGDSTALLSDFYVQGGGWGNEPYSWVRFGLSRDKWFDFRGTFRESDYNWFFPGFARSQHLNDTERRNQSYKLTLLPAQKFRVKLGYKRNSTFGPTLTTFDFSRAEFPGFEPIRTTYDEYTIGAEWNIQRWIIAGEYGYRYFRNDLFLSIFENDAEALLVCGAGSCPNDPADAASLDVFDRAHPVRGKIPFVTLNIAGRPHPTLEANARFVYSGAKSEFTRAEFLDGTTFRQGGANPSTTITENMSAFGETRRPTTTVDGNFTWRPVPRFTVTNNFQYRGYDITGFQDETRFITCGVATVAGCPLDTTTATSALENSFASSFFDLDSFQDRFEARYALTDWLTLRGGYIYLKRDWRHFEFERVSEDGVLLDEEAHDEGFGAINRSWLAGAVIRPNRRVQIFFDLENGDFTRVFNRQGPADLDRYRLRGRFEPIDGLRLNASWFIFDNQNFKAPTPGNADGRHSSRNRGASFDLQLARWTRGYFDIGYSRNDITAITDVFLPGATGGAGVFVYILDDNYFYVDAGGRVAGNLYLDAGYRLVDSSGSFPPSDPVGACVPFLVQSCDNTTLDPFEIFDGGVKLHQPYVSVRYAFSENVSWKFGWRYYDYNQQGGTFSDYNANVVTTSVVLSF